MVELRHQGKRIELPPAGARLGRAPECLVRSDSATVSDVHAEIYREGGRLQVRDAGSLNGTFVNGKRIMGPQPLHHGDVVRCGPLAVLEVEVLAEGEELTAARDAALAEAAELRAALAAAEGRGAALAAALAAAEAERAELGPALAAALAQAERLRQVADECALRRRELEVRNAALEAAHEAGLLAVADARQDAEREAAKVARVEALVTQYRTESAERGERVAEVEAMATARQHELEENAKVIHGLREGVTQRDRQIVELETTILHLRSGAR